MTAAAANLHFSDLPCFPIPAAAPPARQNEMLIEKLTLFCPRLCGRNIQKPRLKIYPGLAREIYCMGNF